MLKFGREEGQKGRKRQIENIETCKGRDRQRVSDVMERQAERKKCTKGDRQRGRDVQGETDREEEMYL